MSLMDISYFFKEDLMPAILKKINKGEENVID